jgi:hypothetical protein
MNLSFNDQVKEGQIKNLSLSPEVEAILKKDFENSFFNVTLNLTPFESKPQKTDFIKINKEFVTEKVNISKLCNHINEGKTFVPSVFQNNIRKNDAFISTQVFALDFDDNQDPTEKIKLFSEYGIRTNIMYYTFSSTDEYKKFRLVFVIDTPITDRKTREKIQLAFMGIAKDSDAACKDAARMFLGCNKTAIDLSLLPNKLTEILPAIDIYINSCVSEPTKRANTQILKNFQKTLSLNSIYKDERKMKENEQIQHYNFEEAQKTSVVLKQFATGTHLKYRPLLVLATNMYYIKGGIKWMKECMDKTGTYKPEDYALLTVPSRYNYLPMDISDFDTNLIGEYKNLLFIDKNRQGVQILQPVTKVDVEEVSRNFSVSMEAITNRDFLNTIGSKIKQVNILKASVGIGKTKKIIRQKNVLIAVPNHKLKNELAERMREEGINFLTTPELPVFNDKTINEKYKFFQDIGDTFKANQLIKEKANEFSFKTENFIDDPELLEDRFLAQEYLRKLNEAYQTDVTVITTHRRAILSHKSFNKKHIIFDEDIFKELLPIVTFKRSDLTSLITEIQLTEKNKKLAKEFEKDIRAVYDYLDKLPTSIIRPTENIVFNNEKNFKEKIAQLKGGEKIIKFLNSDFVLRSVGIDDIERFYSIKKIELPNDAQVTIVSGTADNWIYEKLLNGREYDFHNLGIAKNIVPVIQYTGKAYSKTQIEAGELPELQNKTIAITYKDYKDKILVSDTIAHFGNTSGFDHLKGEKISVIGTPIPHPTIVMLYAKVLGLEYTNQEKEYRSFLLDNYRFDMYTYVDNSLANIELKLTQMELEQAVGRGRTSRTDAQLELFAKVPINSADIFMLKK